MRTIMAGIKKEFSFEEAEAQIRDANLDVPNMQIEILKVARIAIINFPDDVDPAAIKARVRSCTAVKECAVFKDGDDSDLELIDGEVCDPPE